MELSRKLHLFAVVGVCLAGILVAGCDPTDPNLLVNTTVTVPGAGGGADVTFDGVAGQVVHIGMISGGPARPYGFLAYPDGNGSYTPAIADATANGYVNGKDFTLPQTGTYTLTVYDQDNVGGGVVVVVRLVP